MATITNLRLPVAWTTALPHDNNFDVSADELDDDLQAVGDVDWQGTNFDNLGKLTFDDIDGTPVADRRLRVIDGLIVASDTSDVEGRHIKKESL